jgi:hypothetical protein
MEEGIGPNQEIEELLFALYQELRNILGNIKYVNKELPDLTISQALQDGVMKALKMLCCYILNAVTRLPQSIDALDQIAG